MQKDAYSLTSPPINHFGLWFKNGEIKKKGAIWLNENLLSSYDYWQFWRNTDDRDVEIFKIFY